MTEKRFTKQEVYDGINRYRINESNFIVEILDDGIPMHYSTVVNRLNEQHKTIIRLEKENEQLKKEKEYFLKVISAMGDYAEMVDYEKIIDASDAVKRRFLND